MVNLNDYYQIPVDISAIYLDNTYARINFTEPSTRNNPNYYYNVVVYDNSGNYYDASGLYSPITVYGLTFNTQYSCYVELIQYTTSSILSIKTLSWPKIYTFYLSDISYGTLKVRWTGLDISNVKISRGIGENPIYTDISNTYLSYYYPDSELSGNTLYSYYAKPYENYNGTLHEGIQTSTIIAKTLPAPPTDLSAIFYDNSSIQINFTPARNSYSTSYNYILRTTNNNLSVDISGLNPPIQITELSGNTIYTMSVISAIDNSLNLYASSTNLSKTTLVSPPIDISLIYYDNSAIQLSYSVGKNTYNSVYYTLYATDTVGNYKDNSGVSTQLKLLDLSGNTIYTLGVKNTLNGNIALVASSVYGIQLTLTQPPKTLTQTAVDSSSITVGFLSGKNTYNSVLYTASAVLVSSVDGNITDIKTGQNSTTTVNIGDLSGNTKYIIGVSATLDGNSALYSNSLTTITKRTTVQPPTNITTTAVDSSSITVSFIEPKNSYATSQYYIGNVIDNSNNITDISSSSPINTIQFKNLTKKTNYNYKVNTVLTARSSVGTVATYNPYPIITTFSLKDMSYNFVNLNWAGSDISYVRVSRKIDSEGVYSDISNDYITPYQDIDISGNTDYYYYITPIRNYNGTLKTGGVSSVINTRTIVAPATDLSAIYYDTSAIQIRFTSSTKNSYTTSVYYTLRAVNSSTGLYKEISGNNSPLLITDLSAGITYNCYILTILDNNYIGSSINLNITTNGSIKQIIPIPLTSSTNSTEPSNYGGGVESFQMLSFTISNSSYSYANGTYYFSRTSGRDSNAAIIMVDNTTNYWRTNYSTQQYSGGVYIGTNSTVIQTVGTIRGEYAEYKLPYLLKLTSFSVRYREGTAGVAKLIYLCGSTNGTTWYLLSTQTVQTSTVNSLRTYSVSTINYYNYFRLIMNSNYSDAVVDTYSWFLNGIVINT